MTVAAVIQARLTSSRLPAKMIAPLAGRPVIRHLIDRMLAADGVDVVAVAMPDSSFEAPLAASVEAVPGVIPVRGPLDDITRRFQMAQEATGADTIIRVFGDCPAVDPAAVTRLIEQHTAGDAACTLLQIDSGYPVGNECQAISAWALAAAEAEATVFDDREDIVPYLRRDPARFRIDHCYRGDGPASHPIELLLDTEADLARLGAIFSALMHDDPCFGSTAVEALHAARPDLFDVDD